MVNIFYHICTIGRYKEIVLRQFNLIKQSGLLEHVDHIYICVLGNSHGLESVKKIVNDGKVTILKHSTNLKLYEGFTLSALHEHCQQNTDDIVLYIHAKGVSRSRLVGNRMDDWSQLMEYYLIENYQKCLEYLKDADICGVNFHKGPLPHYSGNFWWSTAKYINSLPSVITYDTEKFTSRTKYLNNEMWITSNPNGANYICLYDSNVDHYKINYPRSKYEGVFDKHCDGHVHQNLFK
jgi:hypothetical protein